MVKKVTKPSISEDDGVVNLLNENGKRPGELENSGGAKKLKTHGLYRQPTVRELNRLQETETLFNSNLFRLQVEEVLEEVKVKEKTEKKFQKWFAEFKTHLLNIPEDKNEYDLSEPILAKKLKVKLPINEKLKQTKCVFKFNKFNDVAIVGSYSLNCSINSQLRIDVQITVPSETYTKNDSVNYRYHKKHAAYLAFIASHLNNLEIIDELKFSWLNNSETKPVIDLKPSGKLSNHFTIRIILICESEAYKLHRFSPQRNNLRENWLFTEENVENNSELGPPSPYYNSSILSDLTATANQEFLNKILMNSDNLKQAVVLLKIWLRQRKLQVSGHIVSLLVAYLVQIKRINNIMSSYQIVRNVWIFLKTSEWDKKGISLHKESDSPPVPEFLNHFPVVFLDVTGYYNICWQMHRGTYEALKRESALAIDMLDNGSINSFIPLFMTPVKPLLQFDLVLRFKNLPKLKEAIISRVPKETRVNYGIDQLALVTDTLYNLLTKGLRKRVDLILQLVEADFSWPVKKTLEKAKKESYEEKLSFGFILNPENSDNIVEKGPSANLPEADEFRAFWGDKSELRRFQDGSITETCVWDGDHFIERRTVTRQIVDYLINLKYDIPPSELFHISEQLDSLLYRKQHPEGDACSEESALRVLQAFDELRRDLRGLTELPLDVSAVYGVSPVFSYSDPLPPLAHAPLPNRWQRGLACLVRDTPKAEGGYSIPPFTPVCKAVVELGHSGKWPGDIEAFRCLKAAFNLQISDRLHKQYSLPTQAYPAHVDVLKNGLVFRLEIAHPKEITLLRREIENGVVKHRESDESIKLQRENVLLPRLRGALHGLHQKQPSYGPATCLLKRWLSSHLMSQPHFPAEVAELLVAAGLLRPQPLAEPRGELCAFLRALHLLAHSDWAAEMLILDFNGDMTREEILELERKFSSLESKPAMYIVTSYDGDLPSIWTAAAPSAQVLARCQVLARSALKYFEDALYRDMKENVLPAFIPSLSGYDVLIHLRPALVPHVTERVDARPLATPLPTAVVEDIIPVVQFDPVQRYLDELRNAYDSFALFFHDSYGGEVIAVLWKPDINETRELQLTNANALKPVKSKGEVKYKVNKSAIIEDFKVLGDGLVKNITVNT